MRTALIAALLWVASTTACDSWMQLRGVPTFREVDVAEAKELIAEGEARLIQVRSEGRSSRPVPEAELVEAEGPLPESLQSRPGTVIIVAADRRHGLRYAARLARDAETEVAVLEGGVDAWRAEISQAAAMKPERNEAHPRSLAAPPRPEGDTDDG